MLSRWLKLMLSLLILSVAACGAPLPPVERQSLRGAIVPTRITSTPTSTLTATPTETPTPTLTFTATPAETPSGDSTTPPTTIAIGDSVRGEITESVGELLYRFNASAGDVVTVRMTRDDGTNLDPLLLLFDAEGVLLAENDDAFGTERSVSLIENFVLPSDGTYTIIAARFQRELGSTVGGFTLTLSAGTSESDETAVVPIAYGDVVGERISNVRPYLYYEFEGKAGDVVTIEMTQTSGDLDPFLFLGMLDAQGEFETLAENDDLDANNEDSRIDAFTLPQDGFYLIIATRFNQMEGTSEGDFELRLRLVSDRAANDTPVPDTGNALALAQDAIPLEVGQPQSVVLDASRPLAVFKFAVEAQTVVSLAARGTGLLPIDLVASLISPSGRELGRSVAEPGNRVVGVDALTLTQGGEYLFVIGQMPQRAREGRIEVILQAEPLGFAVAPLLTAQQIRLGDTVEALVTRDTFGVLYTFYLEEGQRVRVEVSSPIRTLGFVWGVNRVGSLEVLALGRRSESSEFTAPTRGYYSLFVRHQLGAGLLTIRIVEP